MRIAGLKAQVGYRKPRHKGGRVSIVSPNRLQRQFTTMSPDEVWVTDITHIRTHEGWLYLALQAIGITDETRDRKSVVFHP